MGVVKASRELKKTIQNVGRLREILSVLASNGFYEFIAATKLHQKVPGFVLPRSKFPFEKIDSANRSTFWERVGYRLRLSFEELGPGFIKIGQLIASREDLLDPALIKEMKVLQNKVKPLDFKDFKDLLDQEFGDLKNHFSEFNEEAIATASIGSVFRAKLLNGEDVVVKLRKPNIKKIIDTDFDLFKLIINQIEKVSDDFKFMGVSRVLDDFHQTVLQELNFNLERRNLKKIKESLIGIDKNDLLVIPKVHDDLCSERIIVMEYLNGTPFNQIKAKEVPDGIEAKLIESAEMFLHNILHDGFFHADLHGGNFLLLENDKIGIIDFGSVGTLSKDNKGSLVSILYCLIKNNYERLTSEFLEIADYETIPNQANLTKDIESALSPFVGLSAQELNATELIIAIVQTLRKHQVFLPRQWYIIFRAIATLDGVGKSLNVDINIFDILEKRSSKLFSMLVSPKEVTEEFVWLSRDLLKMLKVVPNHFNWFVKDIAKKNYVFEVNNPELNNSIKSVSASIHFLAISTISSVLIFSGVYLLKDLDFPLNFSNIPKLSYVFWVIGISLFCSNLITKK